MTAYVTGGAGAPVPDASSPRPRRPDPPPDGPPRRGGGGCCGWHRLPRRSGCGSCSPWARCGSAAIRHAADRHPDRPCAAAPAGHLRVLARPGAVVDPHSHRLWAGRGDRRPTRILLGRSRLFANTFGPLTELARPVPAIAMVPVAILLFPTDEAGIVFITFLAAYSPILVSTRHAVRALPTLWEDWCAPWVVVVGMC